MTLFASVKYLTTLTLVSAFLISLTSSECDRIILTDHSTSNFNEGTFQTCRDDQFECRSGDCIRRALLCDGKADCPDQSDETQAECMKPELNCPNWAFRCDYGACVHKHVMCNGVKDCLDNSDELMYGCPYRATLQVHPAVVLAYDDEERDPQIIPRFQRLKKTIKKQSSLACFVPPQPLNGQWKLHRSFCKDKEDCEVPQGIALSPGSQLVYTCAEEFMLEGETNVYCGSEGTWSSIPICVVATCSPLNSVSRSATCSRFGDLVKCGSPVLPYTRASVTCRINYRPDERFAMIFEQDVECGPNGRWEPEPITCSPACGMSNDFTEERQTINGIPTDTAAFPWHANLWGEISTPRGPELEFRCSATIIKTNFVVTAAHCIFDETIGTTENPSRFRITAGNTNDDPERGHKVENVYRYCADFGRTNEYRSDIALLQLKDPFEFSTSVLPACLDVSSGSERALQPGTTGRIDGFGRKSAGTPSPVLQTAEVTYVSNSECATAYNSFQNKPVIRNDEFCGIFSNETTVCDWDSGGGFVVKKEGLWHLMGVFRTVFVVGTENTQRLCGENPYSLYTKLPLYMTWIQDAMFNLARYNSYPLCDINLKPLPPFTPTSIPTRTSLWFTTPSNSTVSTTPATPTSMTIPATSAEVPTLPSVPRSSCLVPPQPLNGKWRLGQESCDKLNCEIPEDAKLVSGSQLVYSCDPGFQIKGNSDVWCTLKGNWSAIPTCIEITCESLHSVSRKVQCYQSNSYTKCNSSVLPNTKVELSCEVGYKEDTISNKIGSKIVECNENGEWNLQPINCVPVCGLTNPEQSPTIVNGMVADITEFPWHATLYKRQNVTEGSEKFFCGATIIQDNLLLTAAHCVYDETIMAVQKSEKLRVLAGNQLRDYNHKNHDPRIVQSAAVRKVHVPCDYGRKGTEKSDIALIELQEPFKFSINVSPACVDVTGESEQILEDGAVGKIAGFGRTGTSNSSAILLATMIPYVTYRKCIMLLKNTQTIPFITKDRFCAGNKNGNKGGVCDGDSGGGLMLSNFNKWNVLGVLSENLGTNKSSGEITCNENAYSLYTKVYDHMPWIRDVMVHLETYKSYPSCGSN